MSNNLVLVAAVNYKFEQIEFFVKSLRKFYKDKIVFLYQLILTKKKFSSKDILFF